MITLTNQASAKIAAAALSVILTGCGGGGGSPDVSYKAVRVFSDGSGVAIGTQDDNSKGLLLAPEIASLISLSAESDGNDDLDIELEDFPIVGTTATSVIRQGAVSSDGVTQNLLIYEAGNGEDGFALITMPEYGLEYYLTGGEVLANVPSGTFVYRGDQIVRSYSGSGLDQSGTLQINANFDDGTFTYTGQTSTTSMNGTGILEAAQGRFTDTDASLTVGSRSYETTIHGLLHGDGAASAAGVFHSNEATPLYGGAFVAER